MLRFQFPRLRKYRSSFGSMPERLLRVTERHQSIHIVIDPPDRTFKQRQGLRGGFATNQH